MNKNCAINMKLAVFGVVRGKVNKNPAFQFSTQKNSKTYHINKIKFRRWVRENSLTTHRNTEVGY